MKILLGKRAWFYEGIKRDAGSVVEVAECDPSELPATAIIQTSINFEDNTSVADARNGEGQRSEEEAKKTMAALEKAEKERVAAIEEAAKKEKASKKKVEL